MTTGKIIDYASSGHVWPFNHQSVAMPIYLFLRVRRWDSKREPFYDDIVHEFGEITQSKGHYAGKGHSRSAIVVPIESSYTTSC